MTTGFAKDQNRLKQGEPLAYVIGHIPFLDTKIFLDSKPLIPRTETEFWTEKLLTAIRLKNPASPPRILDLCSGSGCIGVALAKNLPTATITFAEIEPQHLHTIEKNLRYNLSLKTTPLPARYRLLVSDLFSGLAHTDKFDYIATNPPYIDPALNRTAETVKLFEPPAALYGGKLGLELIKGIISEAKAHLTSSGEVWLEHEPEQSMTIQSLAQPDFFVSTHTDQYGVQRYSRLVLK